ncbi:MAG: hypothetical protein IT168_15600 [Bryobacterales bacterium]|nr:hypothetical protein [Bryobacterales bacterium]
MRVRTWQISLLVVVVCLGTWGYLEWTRRRADLSDEALYRRLPLDRAVLVSVNVQQMRSAGMLDLLVGSRAAEEFDYKRFIDDTAFDYRQDLDVVMGAFAKNRNLFLLKGRFDWDRIRKWAESRGVKCVNGYCGGDTTRTGRSVSFFMLFPTVMAVGIGEDTNAAYDLQIVRDLPSGAGMPSQPFWIRLPSSVLEDPQSLPAGTKAFASGVKGAERITLGVGPGGEAFEIEMQAIFKDDQQASEARKYLQDMTGTLQAFFRRDKQQPNENDLSGVLVSGRFTQDGSRVVGKWPIRWRFLEAIAGGKPIGDEPKPRQSNR